MSSAVPARTPAASALAADCKKNGRDAKFARPLVGKGPLPSHAAVKNSFLRRKIGIGILSHVSPTSTRLASATV